MLNDRYLRLLLPAGAAGLLCLAAARAQVVGNSEPDSGSAHPVRVYDGVSERGSIQDALDSAVNRALKDLPGADRMIRYRVRDITGERGGIRGANVTRVAIEVTADGALQPAAPRPDAPVLVLTPSPQPAAPAPAPPRVPQPAAEAPVRPRAPQPAREVREEGPLAAVRTELNVEPARIRPGETINLELTVRNTGREAVQIPFPNAQQFDFQVRRGSQTVWRWGRGQVFSEALTSLTLQPGQAKTFTARWLARGPKGERLPPANYQVVGYLTAGGAQVEAKRAITVWE